MPFTIPNEQDAAVAAQSAPDAIDFAIITAGSGGTGVLTGCVVSAHSPAGMSVDVASGSIQVAGTAYAITATTLTIAAADTTSPRFDLIVADSSGDPSVLTGVASGNPVFPGVATGDVVLAAVYVAANATAIQSGAVTDKRVVVLAPVPGPPGPAGGTFLFTQNTPSVSWDIVHDLGFFPAVTVIDSAGTTVEGSVTHLDDNHCRVDFTAAFSGTAALS